VHRRSRGPKQTAKTAAPPCRRWTPRRGARSTCRTHPPRRSGTCWKKMKNQTLMKPVFHFYRFSRVETRRFQAMGGQLDSTAAQPHRARQRRPRGNRLDVVAHKLTKFEIVNFEAGVSLYIVHSSRVESPSQARFHARYGATGFNLCTAPPRSRSGTPATRAAAARSRPRAPTCRRRSSPPRRPRRRARCCSGTSSI
jgi:hypothetical protein